MKKFLFYITIFLLIIGCFDLSIDDSDSRFYFSDHDTLYYTGENALATGTNSISYDSSKTLHTLIYYALDPANEEYSITNSYTIGGSSSSSNKTSTKNAYNSKIVADSLAYDELDNFSQNNNMRSKIIDINKEIEGYVIDNNITPIEKGKGVALYRTIPTENIEVGTQWQNVYVLNTNTSTYRTTNATCVGVSEYAYFFLEDNIGSLTDEQIETLKEAFDKDYYIIADKFGEANDTDGNGKVSFLIADLDEGIFGFFYSADKYSQDDISVTSGYRSNEADVLYVNYKYFVGTDDYGNDNWEQYETDLKATLAHEYQHMVLFDYKQNKKYNTNVATWLNEGLSMLAEYYCGYAGPHYDYIKSYFSNNQGISLINDSSSLDYGLSYLFVRYLQIRFGDEVITGIYDSISTGISAVAEATGMDFNELFLDFVKMILVTGRGIETDTRYNIEEFNYPEGSEGYEENGFNLASLIDGVYDSTSWSPLFNASSRYTKTNIYQYGFVITRWSGDIDTLTIASEYEDVAGFYYAW